MGDFITYTRIFTILVSTVSYYGNQPVYSYYVGIHIRR